VKHILIILSILLLSSPLFGQSGKPKAIIIDTGSLGGINKTRIKILDKHLNQNLMTIFQLFQKKFIKKQKKKHSKN